MAKRLFLVVALIGVLCFVLMAADVTGKWTAQVPGRQGGQAREQTFTFKVAGDTLTGTMSAGQAGEVAISDGKVSGDNISFTVTRERGGNTVKMNFTGVVSGNEIKMKQEGGQGQPREFVAKRAN